MAAGCRPAGRHSPSPPAHVIAYALKIGNRGSQSRRVIDPAIEIDIGNISGQVESVTHQLAVGLRNTHPQLSMRCQLPHKGSASVGAAQGTRSEQVVPDFERKTLDVAAVPPDFHGRDRRAEMVARTPGGTDRPGRYQYRCAGT